MISTIGVHQPPPMPPPPPTASTLHHHHNPASRRQQQYQNQAMTLASTSSLSFSKRQLGIQYLDLTDCVSLEDSGLKMIVETCPQLMYLFLRRCVNITGEYIYASGMNEIESMPLGYSRTPFESHRSNMK